MPIQIDEALRRLEQLTVQIIEKQRELADLEAQRDHARSVVRALALGQDSEPHLEEDFIEGSATPGEREAAEAIRQAGITADRRWLAARLKISQDAAAIRLARAAAKGLIHRRGRGLYFAPPPKDGPATPITVELGREPSADLPPIPLGEEGPM